MGFVMAKFALLLGVPLALGEGGPPALEDDIKRISSGRVADFFKALAASPEFATEVWEKQPFVARGVLGSDVDAVSWTTVGYAAANHLLNKNMSGGLTVTGRDDFVSNVFSKAPMEALPSTVVEKRLKGGSTLYVNRASAIWPPVAALVAKASAAFKMPVNANLYATAAGFDTAVPPHNDIQDTLILQLEGHKVWTLYNAEKPLSISFMEVGKGGPGGGVNLKELGKPVKEVELAPGDVLYVPRGMVHTTHTACDACAKGTYSVSATLGLETAVALTDYHNLITCALGLGGLTDFDKLSSVLSLTLEAENVELRRALPLGFLERPGSLAETAQKALELTRTLVAGRLANGPGADMQLVNAILAEGTKHFDEALLKFKKAAANLTTHVFDMHKAMGKTVKKVTKGKENAARLVEDIKMLYADHSERLMQEECGIDISLKDPEIKRIRERRKAAEDAANPSGAAPKEGTDAARPREDL